MRVAASASAVRRWVVARAMTRTTASAGTIRGVNAAEMTASFPKMSLAVMTVWVALTATVAMSRQAAVVVSRLIIVLAVWVAGGLAPPGLILSGGHVGGVPVVVR